MPDDLSRLQEAINVAITNQQPMRIAGHGSKSFQYPGDASAPLLATSDHTGVVEYRPEELVVTVRAGTSLAELKHVVSEHGQMWACDPPEFGGRGTVGGAIASGWCGPGRPWHGSLRDSLLGVELLNGFGEQLRFGGKVIKNVAGFDISRLLAGSNGTLGVILSASLKLLPAPESTRSVAVPCTESESAQLVTQYSRKTSSLTGTCFFSDILYLRFAGVAAAVEDDVLSFDSSSEVDPKFWDELRDHVLPFFADERPLWRVSLERGASYQGENATQNTEYLAEWNGSLVWLKTESTNRPTISIAPNIVRDFRNVKYENPISTKYASRLKHSFDPKKIFNPGVVL